ncbi:unnamed protein product, partial [Ectocarpus sp. 8 AP-2014]
APSIRHPCSCLPPLSTLLGNDRLPYAPPPTGPARLCTPRAPLPPLSLSSPSSPSVPEVTEPLFERPLLLRPRPRPPLPPWPTARASPRPLFALLTDDEYLA